MIIGVPTLRLKLRTHVPIRVRTSTPTWTYYYPDYRLQEHDGVVVLARGPPEVV